jgi:zinc-ribbon domain
VANFCAQCGTTLTPAAKFCAECGTHVVSGDPVSPPLDEPKAAPGSPSDVSQVLDDDIPSAGITIQFNSSSAANYPFAVRAAQAASSYREFAFGKVITHQATFQRSDNVLMLDLLESLKGFRNRRVWVDGEPTMWDDAFSWVWCYNRRKTAYVPALYCFGEEQYSFNLWGCIHSGMAFAPGARWLAHGSFDRDGAFHLDKDRIRHEIRTALHRYRFCPALNSGVVEDIVTAFPDKINPKHDKDWEYQESYGLLDSGSSALTVRIKENGYTYDRQVNGVQPKSLDAARAILKGISKKLPGAS